MHQFLWGALTMASTIAALFFLRHRRLTGDRLFTFFAVAFAMMALNWAGLAIIYPALEHRHFLYLFRLAAFLVIIFGIVDKNRRGGPRAVKGTAGGA